jgi:hypothetical protein
VPFMGESVTDGTIATFFKSMLSLSLSLSHTHGHPHMVISILSLIFLQYRTG